MKSLKSLISESAADHQETVKHLAHMVAWAQGHRGRKDVNPYGVPEVANALGHLHKLQHGGEATGTSHFDVDTQHIAKHGLKRKK